MAHPFQDMLLLEDAVRIRGPAAFNIMLKPAGSLCNLWIFLWGIFLFIHHILNFLTKTFEIRFGSDDLCL